MNNEKLLVTAVGPDRVGFVDEITGALVAHGANVEESRMARLTGEFAALLLVQVPANKVDQLTKDLDKLRKMEVWVRRVSPDQSSLFQDYRLYTLAVNGADHEGIIKTMAHALNHLRINIAELESDVVYAPEAGTPLFNMRAVLQVPPDLQIETVEESLRSAGEEMCVSVQLEKAD
jgi:glycine cleavage system transcriptional repressor